jgi:hypothetical protein
MIGYDVEVAAKAETLMPSPSETAAANSVGLMFQGAMRSIPRITVRGLERWSGSQCR